MKRPSLISCLLLLLSLGFARTAAAQERETIKVKKQAAFLKAEFDETNYKVVALDKYGNPHENAIKAFTITYSDGKSVYEAPVTGNAFPEKTIRFFTKTQKTATKICLIKIMAEDAEGHVQALPDLCEIVLFPDCKKVNKH